MTIAVVPALLLASSLLTAWSIPGAGPSPVSSPWRACRERGDRHFSALVYGDEPAGIMTALELVRQLQRLDQRQKPAVALLTEAASDNNLGGTLVRGGLAYLDRNQVPSDMRRWLSAFAPSSQLYGRFLAITGAGEIAVDPRRAADGFQQALLKEGVTVLPQAGLVAAEREGQRLCALSTRSHGRLSADVFIDSSIGARLAREADVPMLAGLGPGSLSHESLSLGWVFEVEGLSIEAFRALERRLTERLLDGEDHQAQGWLRHWPQYLGNPERLRADLLDAEGRPRLAYSATADSADQRSPAVSIGFHGRRSEPPGLERGSSRLDPANIAILPDRLSFNALLFRNDEEQNRAVISGGSRPLPWMEPVKTDLTRFFLQHGATSVRWNPELYVRSADQIAHPVEALTADLMTQGGVPRQEALGTFTYSMDFRGGLAELITPAKPTFNFGYRHTLPKEVGNLAVLGPSAGYGGLGEGAGRIIELNISVGEGVAIATALAIQRHEPLSAIDPRDVAQLMPIGYPPYGRPSGTTIWHLRLRRLHYLLDRFLPLEHWRARLPWRTPLRP
jgi:hypothetical protein